METKEPKQIPAVKFNNQKLKNSNLFENSNQVKLYVNAFPISFTKDFNIYEYPYTIDPEPKDNKTKEKIFRELSYELLKCYGNYHISGEILYTAKLIPEPQQFISKITFKGQNTYVMKLDKSARFSTIKKGQTTNFSQIDEKIIFMVIREILLTNPNIKFDRDNLYLENDPVKIKGTNQNYFIHDGYKLSLKNTENGLCLIIGIKNKIKGDISIYDILMDENSNDYGDELEDRIDTLIGLTFTEDGFSKSKKISDIKHNPTNVTRNYNGKTYSIFEYYENVLKKKINDKNQPLICVEVKGDGDGTKLMYYASEYCKLSKINNEDIENYNFMNTLSRYTKLSPDEKIKQIEKCLNLFHDKTEREKEDNKNEEIKQENNNQIKEEKKGKNINEIYNSSDKKRQYYGIEINKIKNDISSFYIKKPRFNNGKNDEILLNKLYEVGREKVSTDKWICLYPSNLEKKTIELLKYFKICSEGLGIKIKSNEDNEDYNWIPMKSNKPKDWIDTVKEQIEGDNIKFVIFFLSKNENNLYSKLKEHSLCVNGYVSQVIKLESFIKAIRSNRGPNSYISKILLQINCKLGGANYFLNLDKEITERNIMMIGIDFGLNSTHLWQRWKKGGMTMVATIDSKFSKFYAQNEIINIDEKYNITLQENIRNFINGAITKYKKENKNKTPKNIVVYRQGISQYQIEYIKSEARIMEEICDSLKANYYYTIINTKTSLKFFEYNLKKTDKERGKYKNPECGLVVLDQITDNKKFEFYLQPQKVTQGSATPTYFHVIFGNMEYPELLIKLTYWSTYIYPNWQQAIRIPHVLKIAEKYSYMTAKITRKRNLDKMSGTLSAI